MRSALYVLVILFSITALAGGFFSGRAAVPQITLQTPMPDPSVEGMPETDEMADDAFSSDPAVMSDPARAGIDSDARLAIAIVDCGHSPALELPFLRLGIPLTLVVEPQGAVAGEVARSAAQAGKRVYVQAQAPLSAGTIAQLHAAFPDASGIAARLEDGTIARGALVRLRSERLRFFDEFADTAAMRGRFTKAGVRYAGRTMTVDDHLQGAYVGYMFEQAVHMGRGTTAIVVARPFPATLRALQKLIAHSSQDGIHFVRLP